MKILTQNPFLFAEPGKNRQKKKKKKSTASPSSTTTQTEEEAPETENNSKEKARARRQAKIAQLKEIIKTKERKREKKRKARKAAQDAREEKTESSDTNSFREETKVPETPSMDQILNAGLKRRAERQKRVERKRVQEFQALDKSKIREILTELHDLHEEHVDLICSIERVKFLHDTQQKGNALFVSANSEREAYSEREARVKEMKQLGNPSNPFLEMLDGDVSDDDYRQLFMYCNTLQTRREQNVEERTILLQKDAAVSAMRDALYYVMRHDWSKAFGKPQTEEQLRNYIQFEISQEELALCVEQTKRKYLATTEDPQDGTSVEDTFSSYFSMNIDSIEGHEDYLLSKITPSVQLEHIRQHLDTLNRVVQDGVVLGQILDMGKMGHDHVQKSYEKLLDDKAMVYFKKGQELTRGGQDIELNFLERALSSLLPSFLFDDEEDGHLLAQLDADEDRLDVEEMKYTIAGNLGLMSTSQSRTFSKTVEWLRLRRRIFQRRIEEKNEEQDEGDPNPAEESRRITEEADLERVGAAALKELQQMAPWHVDHGWSPRSKNIIRLIFGGMQLLDTVVTTTNECVRASERLTMQRRQAQAFKDVFERDVIRPIQEAYGDKMQADAEGNAFASARNVENFERDGIRPVQKERGNKMQADAVNARVLADYKQYTQAQSKRDFQKDVAEPTLRQKRTTSVPVSKCVDFTPFGIVTGDGRMVTELSGLATDGGFSTDGQCLHNQPPAADTGGGFLSTYLSHVWDGTWLDETARSMSKVTDTEHKYGYDYFFKNYIQNNPEAKAANLTQDSWNTMDMAQKSTYMKEFHRLHPSVDVLLFDPQTDHQGGVNVVDQDGRILGRYSGPFDPHSASRLPANWYTQIEYADGVTPLYREHNVRGGGLQRRK